MREHPKKRDLFPDDLTIREAKDRLGQLVYEGTVCPVCEQHAKVYRRKINSTMARCLITMYRARAWEKFVHVPSLEGDTHEVSQLGWWLLVEEERTRRLDGGRSGWWRITERGNNFVRGAITLPKYAVIYNGVCLLHEGVQVGIEDALGQHFNYRQLMEGL